MPGPGRNDPCPCGSGRKVKRCCGQHRGPGENDLARAYLAHQARAAARKLRHLDEDELHDLFDELFDLPELDLTLTITLPQLLTPHLQHLFDAIKADDVDAGDDVIPTILDQLDTPVERARLARAVLKQRDSRRLDSLLAAAAIIDLDSRSRLLLRASLIHTAFIHTGRLRTPAGLRLAA
ncbi:MAG: SEC-C domain-containing protein [Solirubrobacterales bacterium]|nr:SEC-C domain-containing protein [Solirubrobacterales bacterium]